MRKTLPVLLLSFILCSCERVFPNDGIDCMWHLDGVENSGVMHRSDSCWMSLAGHTAVFEGNTAMQGYAQAFAFMRDGSDSLFFDFSMCSDTALTLEIIHNFGMESLTPEYSYHVRRRNSLILSDDSIVLHFTRW